MRQFHGQRRRTAMRSAKALTTAMAVAVTAVVGTAGVALAAAAPLLEESFANNTVTSPDYVVGGSFTPCLTAAGGSGTVPTSCAVAPDVDGSGVARLTDTTTVRSGYLIYNQVLPTKAGLDVTFDQYQWGGSGADGLSFFLVDGRYDATGPAPIGGTLGYAAAPDSVMFGSGQRGFPHGLLGVGFDSLGNNNFAGGSDCTIGTVSLPNRVFLRGPAGDVADPTGSLTGYCQIAPPFDVGNIDQGSGTTRPAPNKARVVVDPPGGTTPKIRVYWNDLTTPIIVADQPAAFATTPTFRFGFAAGTGADTDYHEIGQLEVASVDPISPALTITSPSPVAGGPPGAVVDVPFTVGLDGTEGSETQPITTTLTLGAGANFAGTPIGAGWVCPAPGAGATTSTCTFTPGAIISPGTELPVLTVATTASSATAYTVTGTVDSSDNLPDPPSASTSTVRPDPTTTVATGQGTASNTPTAITVTPTAAGTAPFSYQLVTTPPPAKGTATIDPATGAISFTPAAGISGSVTFTYRVTDANGQTSNPTDVTFTIRPAVTNTDASTKENMAKAVDLAAGTLGTGPITYQVTQPAHGAVTVATDGMATYTPAPGYAGPDSFTYTATDADGGPSVPATVTVEVLAAVTPTPDPDPPAPGPTPVTPTNPGTNPTGAGTNADPGFTPIGSGTSSYPGLVGRASAARLPKTGAELLGQLAVGTVLLATGLGAALIERRKRRTA